MADIVDTAVNAGSFDTLVAAVEAVGLIETLKEPRPIHRLRTYRRCIC